MIYELTGDILAADVEAIVNPVNCVGIMGAGLALQIRDRFRANFAAYAKACRRGDMIPGRVMVYDRGVGMAPRWVVNFPTKRHWRDPSRIEDIEAGLADLVRAIRDRGIGSIAVPALGAGLGGLDWDQVKPRIVSALMPLDGVAVWIFGPRGL